MRVYIISVDELWEYMEDKYGEGNYTETISSVSKEDYLDACEKYGWDLTLNNLSVNLMLMALMRLLMKIIILEFINYERV